MDLIATSLPSLTYLLTIFYNKRMRTSHTHTHSLTHSGWYTEKISRFSSHISRFQSKICFPSKANPSWNTQLYCSSAPHLRSVHCKLSQSRGHICWNHCVCRNQHILHTSYYRNVSINIFWKSVKFNFYFLFNLSQNVKKHTSVFIKKQLPNQ